MKAKKSFLMTFFIVIAIAAVQCTDDEIDLYQEILPKSGKIGPALRTTGSVQILWKGGGQKGETDDLPDTKTAFFHFDAHEGGSSLYSKGEIVYQVLNEDSTIHREIRANVQDVLVDADQKKAWFVATVYFDSKGQEDEHCDNGDEGCAHEDGEDCNHEDEEGCSHDDGGGCEGGIIYDDDGGCDGGCTHKDESGSHEDSGGCEGGSSPDDEGSCGGGGENGSVKMSGKNSRVGQLIAVKVHDGGTPGPNHDGITWKWFSSSGTFIPFTENIPQWPHLCKKTIIEGNLVVHLK